MLRVGDPEHRRPRAPGGPRETAPESAAGDAFVETAPRAPGGRERQGISVADGADALGYGAHVLVAALAGGRCVRPPKRGESTNITRRRDVVASGHRPQ